MYIIFHYCNQNYILNNQIQTNVGKGRNQVLKVDASHKCPEHCNY